MDIITREVLTSSDVVRVDIKKEHGNSFYLQANSPSKTILTVLEERVGVDGFVRYEMALDGQRASDVVLTGDFQALTFLFDSRVKPDVSVEFTLSRFNPRK